ncbi:MAG: PspA/IM30 family protein [Proteobacteria bacterium]|nr:PspA/IM30 family protein [Pseudomonadota bacterium]
MGIGRKIANWLMGKKDETEAWIEDADRPNQARQEVKRQETAVRDYEQAYAEILAMKNRTAAKVKDLEGQLSALEQAAGVYLDRGEEAKATACAEQMAGIEAQLEAAKTDFTAHEQNVARAETEWKRAQKSLDEVRRLSEQIVSSHHVAQGRKLSSKAFDGSGLAQLRAMRERQEAAEGKMDALETIRGATDSTSTEALVQGAGKSSDVRAQEILAKLKAKKGG